MTLFYLYIRLFSFFIQCELEARADYIALYIHVTETGKGRIHTVCICILLSYQVCCFVTNVVKIIPSSECLFLLPFLHCLCMGEKREKGEFTPCICILLSYQRVKEESSRQLMFVWLFHLKKHNADYTGYTCT